ncbi:U6 snRNP-associated protein Lsm7 [Thecaphora frezii]
MADRGGRGRGAPRGAHPRGAPARGRGAPRGTGRSAPSDRPKKEAILDLSKYLDQRVRVKFAGGREVQGVLKGYDQLMNLVMDQVEETLRDENGEITPASQKRELGLAVLRGTALTVINPADGFESIANPFASAE